MNVTSTDVRSIPALGHDEAMGLARAEYARFLELVSTFGDADWSKSTDCTHWDVRSLLAHNHGIFEASASVREMARQQIKAARRANDAVEFCRILSGRATGSGLLETKVMF